MPYAIRKSTVRFLTDFFAKISFTVFVIIRAQMNKFNDEEFDIAEYVRSQQKRKKRIAIGVIIVTAIVLAGMIAFWH